MIYATSVINIRTSTNSNYLYDCIIYNPNYIYEDVLNSSNLYAGNTYTFGIIDNKVFIFGLSINSSGNGYQIRILPYGVIPFVDNIYDYSYSSSILRILKSTNFSNGVATLKEGWYINYMGCIYDYQGNIVE